MFMGLLRRLSQRLKTNGVVFSVIILSAILFSRT